MSLCSADHPTLSSALLAAEQASLFPLAELSYSRT